MENVTLGFAPTRRNVFCAEDAQKYKNIIKNKIESFGLNIRIVDLEGINDEGLLYGDFDCEEKIVERFTNEKVDALFSHTAILVPKIA